MMFTGDILNKEERLKNSLGIPGAVFVDNVDTFMSAEENTELVLTKLDEQFGKYKFMEVNLFRKKKILSKQVPDMKASLDMLKLLKMKKAKEEMLDTHFLMCDDLYLKAHVPPTDKIGLWLGANVMLEYDLDDAEELLTKNLKAAIKNLSQIEVDLDFLREQLTTIEVMLHLNTVLNTANFDMARIYNWDVKRRAKEAV